MINNVVLVGRLTKDVELKKTQSNTSVARFTLAVDKLKKENGANFISCVAWKGIAETLSKYTQKGSQIGITGHIETNSYEGQNGKVYTTDIVVDTLTLLSKKEESQNGKVEKWDGYESNTPTINGEQIEPDELPFY